MRSISNLSRALSSQDKYDKAEEIHGQALALMKRVLGKEHPDTLTSMDNLAKANRVFVKGGQIRPTGTIPEVRK